MTAEEKLAKIAEIYDHRSIVDGLNMSTHARHNLWGAIIDLERAGADAICMQTLYRVLKQLAEIEQFLPLERKDHEQV